MKTFYVAIIGCVVMVLGCESTDIENNGGTVTVVVEECETSSSEALGATDAGTDLPGVVATCDDHKPCTVDIQCTPCSAVPESIRYIKATCTPDNVLSPFCFVGEDITMRALVYAGCVHFIQDPTPPGVINSCFPVQFPDDLNSEVHAGVCDQFGMCVEHSAP